MKASRRAFLRRIALGSEPAVSSPGDKILVCIFLRGGADTLNMVVPYADDQYYRLRPTLSISPPSNNAEAAIRLDGFYALHPKLAPLFPIFDEGRLGIVQAVGSDNSTGSHFEAQDQMEHGEAYGHEIGGGWIGRYLRTRLAREMTPLSAVAIGPTISESLRGAPSASAIQSVDEIQIKAPSGDAGAMLAALSSMYEAEVGLLSQPGRATLDLLNRAEALRGRGYRAEWGAEYPTDSFGSGLREVAWLIKANIGLEVACVDLGGWDTHFFQGAAGGLQGQVIDELARGLAAFDADLTNYRERVTTVVMTEFGRRVYENGSLGTDHGRGFALMAIGGRVNGGKVIGEWPGLVEDEAEGPGGLKIRYDYRSVLAEVLRGRMGCSDVGKVFPDFEPEVVGLVRDNSSTNNANLR
jgi:uncharacterized protein (DUF1501 family)